MLTIYDLILAGI